MDYFEWSDKYDVGITKINNQHKKLVALTNQLYKLMSEGHAQDVLAEVVAEMIDYAREHFTTEEICMKMYDFPDYEAHKKEHDAFIEKVEIFNDGLFDGRTALTVEIALFLKNWLINHIQGTDKLYGPFLNEHGLN